MNVQALRKRLSKEGPLVVRTSDGQEYAVPHPEFVWVGRHNLVIEDEQGGIDVIDPLHVVAIRRVQVVKGENGN